MKNPNYIGRTANAAVVAAILAATHVPAYAGTPLSHGLITAAPDVTANASMFEQAHYSEPMTQYATGWTDADNLDAICEFLAPSLLPSGELYEHTLYPNAESFLSDEADDDLRPIDSDFKTIEITESKQRRSIPNRGLRIVVDYERVKNTPNWQQLYTARIMQRLQRNAFRRKYALGVAAGAAAALTWDSSSDPDYDLANQAKLCGDSSGIAPNRALWGLAAKLARFSAYGGSNTAKAMAGRSLSPEEACSKIGLDARVSESRYQTGATKTAIAGAKILLFSAYGQSGEDSSNFKTARGVTQQGGRYAVYVRQLSVKFWEIVVECYETEFCATTLGCRTLTIS
ncbi:MAG: hypothetical protein ABIT76_08655 [Chthoniobacterales bacterium]